MIGKAEEKERRSWRTDRTRNLRKMEEWEKVSLFGIGRHLKEV